MDKRYQVFISSTFTDLLEARQEVMQALLELDCIPAGMELFPAADEDQWSLIKRVIDDCDYYIVIIAGRYGSIGPGGKSYTQMEYEYANSIGKPVIGFLHKNPGKLPADLTEKEPDGITGLETFKKIVEKRVIKYWETPADLGSVVSRSLVNLIKQKPAIGWVKADLLPSEDVVKEMLELRVKNDELKGALEEAVGDKSKQDESLSQGDDLFKINYTFRARDNSFLKILTYRASFEISWDQIFASFSPQLIDEASDYDIKKAIDRLIQQINFNDLREQLEDRGFESLDEFQVDLSDFDTVKVQFLSLNLIQKSIKNRSVRDKANYWSLTSKGETYMTKMRAIRRKGFESSTPTPSKSVSELVDEET